MADVIDLNYDLPEPHTEMIRNAILIESDIDGFRCDMAMLVLISGELRGPRSTG
jgi:hypothetical protein